MNVEKIKNICISLHEKVNHKYDGHPYSMHLSDVFYYAADYSELIPEKDRDIVYAACWAHDTIEDTRQTYNDIKKLFGEQVADIVYAVTNEKGKTRKERANYKYYEGIRNTKYATFVKLCDRLSNVQYSKIIGSDMFKQYKSENQEFTTYLYCNEYKLMFSALNRLLYEG